MPSAWSVVSVPFPARVSTAIRPLVAEETIQPSPATSPPPSAVPYSNATQAVMEHAIKRFISSLLICQGIPNTG